MNKEDITAIYSEKSTIELIMIADSQSDKYTTEACDIAKKILYDRLGIANNFQEIWQLEISRLFSKANKCTFCQSDKISYSTPFYLCKRRGIKLDLPSFYMSAITLTAFGGGIIYTNREYEVKKLSMNLCKKCEQNKSKKSLFGKSKVSLAEFDYYKHPLCELYMPFGFNEIKFDSDFN